MIMIWGIPSEPPVRKAIDAAERQGREYVLVNQRRAVDDDLVIDAATGSGVLHLDQFRVELDRVTGVYVRIMDPARVPDARTGRSDRRDRSRAFHAMLLAWADSAACRVANRTAAMASNGSKPYQAQLIAAAGFDVPPTLVTNDPAEVAIFEQEHGELVFKSISSVRSIVRPLDDAARERLHLLRHLPVQFQRRERGTDVRVHVVGDQAFAARATTDAVDYRYASHDGQELLLEPTALDDEVATKCVGLSRALELPFCGIDLMQRPDESWVCFEVNPSPGYSWYEDQVDLPISDALVAWLAGSD